MTNMQGDGRERRDGARRAGALQHGGGDREVWGGIGGDCYFQR